MSIDDTYNFMTLSLNEITRLGEQFHLLANRFSIAFQFSGEIRRPQMMFLRLNEYIEMFVQAFAWIGKR